MRVFHPERRVMRRSAWAGVSAQDWRGQWKELCPRACTVHLREFSHLIRRGTISAESSWRKKRTLQGTWLSKLKSHTSFPPTSVFLSRVFSGAITKKDFAAVPTVIKKKKRWLQSSPLSSPPLSWRHLASGSITLNYAFEVWFQGGKKRFHTGPVPHVLIYTYSKCSIKAGSLRELTRWSALSGRRPIGTFLPVYDLLHAHTGRRALKNDPKYSNYPHSRSADWDRDPTKETKSSLWLLYHICTHC